jgi:peptidoglycan hydrolase-like protein with peptidoglycan-binding domain
MNFKRTLKTGDTGEDVKWIQSQLTKYGFYNKPIDGVYSNSTNLAVIKFQKSLGLNVGDYTHQTWSNLTNYNPNNIIGRGFNLEEYKKPIINLRDLVSIYTDKSGFKIYGYPGSFNSDVTTKSTIVIYGGGDSIFEKDKEVLLKKVGSELKPIEKNYSYRIGLDGVVINTYDDRYWSDVSGLDLDRYSVSIQLCGIKPGDGVRISYKGYDSFVPYTDKQLKSLSDLLKYLSNKHNIEIPKVDEKYFEWRPYWNSEGGIRFGGALVENLLVPYPNENLIKAING